MKLIAISFLSILVIMLIIDSFWLFGMYKRFYIPNIGHLLNDSPKFGPAIVFYLLYASALSILVVVPALRNDTGFLEVFFYGVLFGLVTYGTYDLTNQATLKDWPLTVTLVDLAWGSFLTGILSISSLFITKQIL